MSGDRSDYARKHITRKIRLQFKVIFRHSKPLILLGFYLILTNIYTVLPATLLGLLSTKVAVGYYYAADKIIRIVISLFTALSVVMIPKLNMVIEKQGREEW